LLAVTKGLVDLHFGKISVSSNGEGQGSTFTVEVPLHVVESDDVTPNQELDNMLEIERSQSQDAVVAIDETSPLYILVVDDAASNRKMLIRLLEKKGHECVDAEDGAEGVMKFRTSAAEGRVFEVILMDYQMPEMDGPAAIKVIRSEGFRGFIIGLTGNIACSDKEIMMEAGADFVLEKPFNLNDFDCFIRSDRVSY
jgi:hypothetical protein